MEDKGEGAGDCRWESLGPRRRGCCSPREASSGMKDSRPLFEPLLCFLLAVTCSRLPHLTEVQPPHLQVRDPITVLDCLLFAPTPLLFPSL